MCFSWFRGFVFSCVTTAGFAGPLAAAGDPLARAPLRFAPLERVEYIAGLGEALYLDGSFGAAATVFDSVLQGGELITGDARARLLDWWATAVDREARPRTDNERHAAYQRIRGRMEDELATHPGSAVAAYWLAAGARLQGDLQGAWD